mmetsp:Transcript_43224/g.41576  ORF Transcript_43224/g.41576 Transcript_43224/m.41576 type:complete len:130 (+) Transcript_43224:908-1297(+)
MHLITRAPLDLLAPYKFIVAIEDILHLLPVVQPLHITLYVLPRLRDLVADLVWLPLVHRPSVLKLPLLRMLPILLLSVLFIQLLLVLLFDILGGLEDHIIDDFLLHRVIGQVVLVPLLVLISKARVERF